MHNIGDAFAALVASTNALHERFDTAQTVEQALARVSEETYEVAETATWAVLDDYDHESVDRAAGEIADAIVTLQGVARALGISDERFAAALLVVAAKNDAKTHDTHYLRDDGKIARKQAGVDA